MVSVGRKEGDVRKATMFRLKMEEGHRYLPRYPLGAISKPESTIFPRAFRKDCSLSSVGSVSDLGSKPSSLSSRENRTLTASG